MKVLRGAFRLARDVCGAACDAMQDETDVSVPLKLLVHLATRWGYDATVCECGNGMIAHGTHDDLHDHEIGMPELASQRLPFGVHMPAEA
jgi:hypothetical protein